MVCLNWSGLPYSLWLFFLRIPWGKRSNCLCKKKFLKGQSQKKRMIPKNGQTIQHSIADNKVAYLFIWCGRMFIRSINQIYLALCFTSSSLQAPSSNLKWLPLLMKKQLSYLYSFFSNRFIGFICPSCILLSFNKKDWSWLDLSLITYHRVKGREGVGVSRSFLDLCWHMSFSEENS